MERVAGIGGVFFKARDPETLAEWYRRHLGVPLEEGQPYGVFLAHGSGDQTVWATFPESSGYFGRDEQRLMVNFRVRDLDAMLEQLRGAGIEVLPDIQEDDNGRFGWAVDPEGNRFELWQPR